MRQISEGMIMYYLGGVTVHWFDDHDVHADKVEEYRKCVEHMRHKAARNGDLEDFMAGLDHLLCQPTEFDLERFNRGYYPFSSKQMRDIIRFARKEMGPGQLTPARGKPEPVQLVPESYIDWLSKRLPDGSRLT